MEREQLVDTAEAPTKLIREWTDQMPESDIRYEFSSGEFTDTDVDFPVELCDAVSEAWGKAAREKPMIMNLPATVERRPPNHYADIIELFVRQVKNRDSIWISLHRIMTKVWLWPRPSSR